MERVKRLSQILPNGCWKWIGTHSNGQPIIRILNSRKLYSGRRYAYEKWNEVDVPSNWVVTVRCETQDCVNPAHLMALRRGHHAKRQWGLHPPEYCQRGHEFSPWNTGQQTRGRLCLVCDRANRRRNASRWNAENPKHAVEVRRARLETRKAYVTSQKIACLSCGETDPDCLDFHHRDPGSKAMTVSQAMRGPSFARLKAEIEKCDVICANCHRKQHAKE